MDKHKEDFKLKKFKEQKLISDPQDFQNYGILLKILNIKPKLKNICNINSRVGWSKGIEPLYAVPQTAVLPLN